MMKIVADNSFVRNFEDIPIGQVFNFENGIYIKIEEVKMPSGVSLANAVYLDGERTSTIWFGEEEKVIPYTNAELTLSF